MIRGEKCIVLDVDGTICPTLENGQHYKDLVPYPDAIARINSYKEAGFYIIVTTSRNMRTFDGNMGQILANTAPVLIEWLNAHRIPFDELHFGKPWAGKGGFYVDDRAIRPNEFLSLNYQEIERLLAE